MNKRVYNGTAGKIVRTFGFLFVLISSLYISTYLVIQNSTLPFVDKILPFAEKSEDIINALPAFIEDYIGLMLIVGLLMLTWVLRKGLVLRVLITVALVFGFFESALNSSSSLAPITLSNPAWMNSILDLIEPFFNQLVALSEYIVPAVMVAAPLFLWGLFAHKKPGRFSVLMLRIGTVLLFLAVLMLALGDLFLSSLAAENWYLTTQTLLYMATYLLFIVGGVFGLIGFSRK